MNQEAAEVKGVSGKRLKWSCWLGGHQIQVSNAWAGSTGLSARR